MDCHTIFSRNLGERFNKVPFEHDKPFLQLNKGIFFQDMKRHVIMCYCAHYTVCMKPSFFAVIYWRGNTRKRIISPLKNSFSFIRNQEKRKKGKMMQFWNNVVRSGFFSLCSCGVKLTGRLCNTKLTELTHFMSRFCVTTTNRILKEERKDGVPSTKNFSHFMMELYFVSERCCLIRQSSSSWPIVKRSVFWC